MAANAAAVRSSGSADSLHADSLSDVLTQLWQLRLSREEPTS